MTCSAWRGEHYVHVPAGGVGAAAASAGVVAGTRSATSASTLAGGQGLCQSDKISHIDIVIFHIDTDSLGSFPSRDCHLVILSSCGQDDHIISCHSDWGKPEGE